jgi:hypothetical protein
VHLYLAEVLVKMVKIKKSIEELPGLVKTGSKQVGFCPVAAGLL